MGGLVVKKVRQCPLRIAYIQAIIDAHNDRLYTRILENAKAVVFLGTPHRGSNLASLLGKLLFVSFSQRKYVTQLQVNSELIQLINDQFRGRSESLELISFHESTEVRGIGVRSSVNELLRTPAHCSQRVGSDRLRRREGLCFERRPF
jgi:hypothetical protein